MVKILNACDVQELLSGSLEYITDLQVKERVTTSKKAGKVRYRTIVLFSTVLIVFSRVPNPGYNPKSAESGKFTYTKDSKIALQGLLVADYAGAGNILEC